MKAKGSDGLPLVSSRQVTGFTNSEEEAVGKTKVRRGGVGVWEGSLVSSSTGSSSIGKK